MLLRNFSVAIEKALENPDSRYKSTGNAIPAPVYKIATATHDQKKKHAENEFKNN